MKTILTVNLKSLIFFSVLIFKQNFHNRNIHIVKESSFSYSISNDNHIVDGWASRDAKFQC